MNIRGWEPLIILLIVLVLFGASCLPGLARSMGRSARIFKDEVTGTPTDEQGNPIAPDDTDRGEQPKA